MKDLLDKEYAGITGVPEFTKGAAILAYGADSAPLKEGRVSGSSFFQRMHYRSMDQRSSN